MASLGSVRQKIDHAKSHFELVKFEMNGYLNTHPGEFVPNANGDPNQPTFVLKPKSPIPEKIGLIVGDCLQNLRSSLDYLIWELVLKAGNIPGKKNMFPITLTASAFQDAKRAHRLQGVNSTAAALIDALQPYHDGKPSETYLAILDELTNVNKHRRLLLTEFSSFSIQELFVNWDAWVASGSRDISTLAHDTGFGRTFTPEQVKMQGDLVEFIAFNEGAVTGMEVSCAIEAFIGLISNVVDRFEVFFP